MRTVIARSIVIVISINICTVECRRCRASVYISCAADVLSLECVYGSSCHNILRETVPSKEDISPKGWRHHCATEVKPSKLISKPALPNAKNINDTADAMFVYENVLKNLETKWP